MTPIAPDDLIFEGIMDQFPDAIIGFDHSTFTAFVGLKVVFVSLSPSTKKPRINVLHVRNAIYNFLSNGSTNFDLIPIFHFDSVENEQNQPVIPFSEFPTALKTAFEVMHPKFRVKKPIFKVGDGIAEILKKIKATWPSKDRKYTFKMISEIGTELHKGALDDVVASLRDLSDDGNDYAFNDYLNQG